MLNGFSFSGSLSKIVDVADHLGMLLFNSLTSFFKFSFAISFFLILSIFGETVMTLNGQLEI